MDQIEGLEPIHENWGDVNLGEELDEGGGNVFLMTILLGTFLSLFESLLVSTTARSSICKSVQLSPAGVACSSVVVPVNYCSQCAALPLSVMTATRDITICYILHYIYGV
jgi:hypothetical protein